MADKKDKWGRSFDYAQDRQGGWVAAPVCLLDLAAWAWLQAAECFTWNKSVGNRG
jgi:hypothetical protein